jgi:hypothetical protein
MGQRYGRALAAFMGSAGTGGCKTAPDAVPNRMRCARQAVQAQLQRCELLVRIGQYDNARMQLREGAFKTLRLDLGYGQEMYRLVSQQVCAPSRLHARAAHA